MLWNSKMYDRRFCIQHGIYATIEHTSDEVFAGLQIIAIHTRNQEFNRPAAPYLCVMPGYDAEPANIPQSSIAQKNTDRCSRFVSRQFYIPVILFPENDMMRFQRIHVDSTNTVIIYSPPKVATLDLEIQRCFGC